MASIKQRGKKWCVVFRVKEGGKLKQKWVTFDKKADAEKYKHEVNYKQSRGEFVPPTCTTVEELMKFYVELYGKERWGCSMYESQTGLIRNYINPIIGKEKIQNIKPLYAEKFISDLKNVKCVSGKYYKSRQEYLPDATRQKILKLCRTAFDFALKQELILKNPFKTCTMPVHVPIKRRAIKSEDIKRILELCNTDKLRFLFIAINISFACSPRCGEVTGLTWDNVHISDKDVAEGNAHIYICQELARVDISKLGSKDKVYFTFPTIKVDAKTRVVLKNLKTESSLRKIWLPNALIQILRNWKKEQDYNKELLGDEYHDYNLVVCQNDGNPCEESLIMKPFRKILKQLGINNAVFHSLRHSSATYKMALSDGDIKSVQGDTGHATTAVLMDVYTESLDDKRKVNAEKFDKMFYKDENNEKEISSSEQAKTIADTLLKNPELMAEVMKSLSEK